MRIASRPFHHATNDLLADLDACRASAVISVVGAGPAPAGLAVSPSN